MAEEIEQKIKLSYETNADQAAGEVKVLSDNMEKVAVAETKTEKATKSLEAVEKSFKLQLKEANAELLKNVKTFGATSKEATEAAKRVAELRDQMEFARDLVDNFNPDQKFKALGAATQIAATGTSAVVSGFALMGVEGEETSKMLLKVQAAMAFSDSIKGLSDLGDQWDLFKTVVADGYKSLLASRQREIVLTEQQTVAQRIQNAVAKANPYILLATLIVAVTIATVAWYKASSEAAEQQKKVGDAVAYNKVQTDGLRESIERYNDEMKDSNDIEVLRAKALGQTDAQIQKLIKSQSAQRVNDALTAEKESYQNLLKAQKNYSKAVATEDEDLIEKASEAQKAAQDLWKQQSKAYGDAITDDIKTNLQATIDENKRREDLQKQAVEKARAARDKAKQERDAAAREKAAEDKRRYDQEQELLKIQNDAEKAFLDEIDAAKKAYSDRLKTDLERQTDDENTRYQEQLEKAKQFNKDTEDIELEHLNILNDIKLEAQQKEYDQQKAIDDAKLAYKKELSDAEMNLAEKGASFLSAIAGKNKALQKVAILAESGVGIAKMIVANQAANIGALATPQAIATSGASAAPVIAMNNISTGLAVATNVAATAKALSALGGGGSASGASSAKTANGPGGASGSNAPKVEFQGSSENQISNGVAGRIGDLPPLQAFVVASEVTTAQQLEANAISSNSIGGAG